MKKYLFIILCFSLGCTESQNKTETQTQNSLSADTSRSFITNVSQNNTTIQDTEAPTFDISKAKIIDSISNPKACLYNQEYDGPINSYYSHYNVQYLLLYGKKRTDTIEVGRNEDVDIPFSTGKIIQYYPYKKNSLGIVLELTYAACHGGACYCASTTYWKIFDLESRKEIFFCTPNTFSDEWVFNTDTIYKPHSINYNGYSIEIKNAQIIIKEQVKKDIQPDSDGNKDSVTYSNENPDLKYGTYAWRDTDFVLINNTNSRTKPSR